MIEILESKERVAKKEHVCNYCSGKIAKGERYNWTKLTNSEYLYEWKTHLNCKFIANELWDYIDPDEGMTGEAFNEGCAEFCGVFICPDCKEREDNCYYCLDKIYNLLQIKELTLAKDKKGGFLVWKLVSRESEEPCSD